MKLFTSLLALSLILISCGQEYTQPEQSAEELLKTQTWSEDANSTTMSDARETYQENCEPLQEAYLSSTEEDFSYQIVTEILSTSSNNCLLGYYITDESGTYRYTLYNLSSETLLGELECEADEEVQTCSADALQNLRMEYEYLLETYRNI